MTYGTLSIDSIGVSPMQFSYESFLLHEESIPIKNRSELLLISPLFDPGSDSDRWLLDHGKDDYSQVEPSTWVQIEIGTFGEAEGKIPE